MPNASPSDQGKETQMDSTRTVTSSSAHEHVEGHSHGEHKIITGSNDKDTHTDGNKTNAAASTDTNADIDVDVNVDVDVDTNKPTTNNSSLPAMCLEECHRFHTNPSLSRPKILMHETASTNVTSKITNSTTDSSNLNTSNSMNPGTSDNNVNHSSTGTGSGSALDKPTGSGTGTGTGTTMTNAGTATHATTVNGNTSTSTISKSLKRKQRLAQYKVQSQSSTGGGTPGTGGSDHHHYHHYINSHSHHKLLPGLPCHAVWAPNTNNCKNAELLAIASPLNLNTVHGHGSGGSGNANANANANANNMCPGNNNSHNHNALNAHHNHASGSHSHGNNHNHDNNTTNTSGSHVYVLVFDEGTFAHNGEFNLSDELCELFGLPVERIPEKEKKRGVACGLRRPVFYNKSKWNSQAQAQADSSGGNGGGNLLAANAGADQREKRERERDRSQSVPSTTAILQKRAKKFYRNITTNCIQPFASHIVSEFHNCHRMFKYEVVDDGRIFGNRCPHSQDILKDYSKGLLGSKTQVQKEKEVKAKGKTEIEAEMMMNNTDTDTVNYNADANASPCPVRPQLVFHINLPYSSTSMEVTSLEWNADGTTLSIVQRRKGSSNSFSTVASSLTNKKKKSSLHNVAPGNTAVSFWSIPEWIHVACDEMKMCDENDDLRYETDGIIMKANNVVEDTIGWEVGLTDENRSLFPLWEWYLAKYIFHDEAPPPQMDLARGGKRSKILMKNCMEYTAYPMELSATSNSVSTRVGKKAVRSTRGTATANENANAIMSGDVTCLIWEESPICANDFMEEDEEENEEFNHDDKISKNSDFSIGNDSKKKEKGNILVSASKWVAIGTSKGQMILHNGLASYASYQTKKASKKSGDNSKHSFSNVHISPQSRTVTIPVRHKKRITCGAWVDNLLVYGNVSTGCLTLVSTFPKSAPIEDENTNSSNTTKVDIFAEKSAKVLGSILLPGGKDAVNVNIGSVDGDFGNVTILSVNCEGKSLLFYTFPKFDDPTNINNQASSITSSPAKEVNFSIASSTLSEDGKGASQSKGNSNCGNIIFHYLIPNTFLALVAFSSGYIALVDWFNGVILSDDDIRSEVHSLQESHDNYVIDVAFHVDTSTLACLAHDGNVVAYHIRILDGCHNVKAGDCVCTTGMSITTKTHTRPKTKSSANLVDCDSSVKRIMGTIDFLCVHSVPSTRSNQQSDTRKGNLINFSADGECVSISLGDESVAILSINVADDETDRLKRRLAQSAYHGRDNVAVLLMSLICGYLIWTYGKAGLEPSFRVLP